MRIRDGIAGANAFSGAPKGRAFFAANESEEARPFGAPLNEEHNGALVDRG
jgi:hypothetical protein